MKSEKSPLKAPLFKASCAVAALTDAGFAASVAKELAAADPETYEKSALLLKSKSEKIIRRRGLSKKKKKGNKS